MSAFGTVLVVVVALVVPLAAALVAALLFWGIFVLCTLIDEVWTGTYYTRKLAEEQERQERVTANDQLIAKRKSEDKELQTLLNENPAVGRILKLWSRPRPRLHEPNL